MKTNSLKKRFNIEAKNGMYFSFTVKLADDCKNGHEDFSITGSYWEKGDKRIERNSCSGAIGDTISENLPEFKIFNDLHLCDFNGVPMHFIANGYYHLMQGFSRTKTTDKGFNSEYCEYYRITPEELEILKTAHSQTHFGMLVFETEIFKRYKAQAKEAIKLLEDWTGETFASKHTKTNVIIEEKDIKLETEKIKQGYYTKEAKKERINAAKDVEFKKMEDTANKKIQTIKDELIIDKKMFSLGIKNYIFYNHSNTLKFNWKGYEKFATDKEIETAKKGLNKLIKKGLKVTKEA